MKTWSSEKANAWYEQIKWQVGLNFVPSNAINPTDMALLREMKSSHGY